MTRLLRSDTLRRTTALMVTVALALPLLTAPARGQIFHRPQAQPGAPRHGMTRGQKAVVVLAGAALLYYLYKKHQAASAAQGQAGKQPQLYRSRNGAIYYRDPKTHKAIWVTAPQGGVAVPADQVQRYAPDYQRYARDPAQAPPGAQTVPATQYDPSLAGAG